MGSDSGSALSTLGTIGGGAAGFLLSGGNPLGAMAGASLGGGLLGGLSGAGQNTYSPHGAILSPALTPQQMQQLGSQGMTSLDQQRAFANRLAAQGMPQLQAQYQAAQAMASGQGPNLGQAMLNQATGQNIANQAALMAGQRGASSNVGMLARQAAMRGGDIQQQAAGQGAIMGAQQQLAGQQLAAQIAQQQLQGGMQAGQLANQQQAQLLGQGQAQEQMNLQNVLGTNQIKSGQAQANANRNAGLMGGLLGAAGTVAGMFGGAGGADAGMAPGGGVGLEQWAGMAHGGEVLQSSSSGPRSMLGRSFMNMQSGGGVPGKASVAGDSPKNDVVPAMLSPGEIVIPRSVVAGGPDKAAQFVAALMAKKGR